MTSTAGGWLGPLLRAVPGLTDLDVQELGLFEETLARLLAASPSGAGGVSRLCGRRLAWIRRELAAGGLAS